MYESFFNLKSKPFDLLPNPEFLFPSKSHKRAMTYLDYGIRERTGFILLTGEVGSGKTTIIRDLINKRHERVILSKIFNTRVDDFDQLIAMVNEDFNLPIEGKDKIALLRDLNDFLIDQYARGNKPTLIIDEAQNLTPQILEEIRMLSNLETDDAKLLQIILVGQPELRKTLAMPSLLQLRQRISIYSHIHPLSRQEVEEYILHRMGVAGNREAVRFSGESIDIIFTYSRGIPRLINIICDFLMISAFAEERTDIDKEMVQDIIGDLDFENQYWTNEVPEKIAAEESASTIAGTIRTESEVAPILLEITERLDKMEKESTEYRKTVDKEFDEKLASWGNALLLQVQETVQSFISFTPAPPWGNALLRQVQETGASIGAINKKIENVIKERESLTEYKERESLTEYEEEKSQKDGFLRKIFK
ncbi:MAG TPA: XrtA/PEP-CTERM system-associated ATPase [Geobacteraceae bacterium]|nr:XrtA/PEP-CTERM system-associated ATPase [Geobacteraceae bacterium]